MSAPPNNLNQAVITALGASLIKIFDSALPVGTGRLAVSIAVAGGGSSINALELHAWVLDQEVTITNQAFNFLTPVPPILASSGDLTAIGSGNTAWMMFDLRPFSEFAIYAKCAAAGPTNVTVKCAAETGYGGRHRQV